jgi:hypothetical protein
MILSCLSCTKVTHKYSKIEAHSSTIEPMKCWTPMMNALLMLMSAHCAQTSGLCLIVRGMTAGLYLLILYQISLWIVPSTLFDSLSLFWLFICAASTRFIFDLWWSQESVLIDIAQPFALSCGCGRSSWLGHVFFSE